MAKLNQYNVEARYIPSLVCSVPFFFFAYYYVQGMDNDFWNSAAGLAIGGVGLSAAMLIVMVNFCRNFGKFIEEKIFNDGLSFPTTTFLLDYDKNLSSGYKKKIIEMIKDRFDIDLIDETEGTADNRRTINEAVRRINSMFFGKSDLILQRTIQFGFAKNILAGSIIATFVSEAGVVVSALSNNITAMHVATVLLVLYTGIALIAFASVRFVARHYAQALYGEFIASK